MPAEIRDVQTGDRRIARDAGGDASAAWRAPSSKPRFVASLTRLHPSASSTVISSSGYPGRVTGGVVPLSLRSVPPSVPAFSLDSRAASIETPPARPVGIDWTTRRLDPTAMRVSSPRQ